MDNPQLLIALAVVAGAVWLAAKIIKTLLLVLVLILAAWVIAPDDVVPGPGRLAGDYVAARTIDGLVTTARAAAHSIDVAKLGPALVSAAKNAGFDASFDAKTSTVTVKGAGRCTTVTLLDDGSGRRSSC